MRRAYLLSLVCWAAGCAGVVLAAFLPWAGSGKEGQIGLRGLYVCSAPGSGCEDITWSKLLAVSHDTRSFLFAWSGRFTFGLAFAVSAVALVAGGLLVRGNPRGYGYVLIATLVLAASALVFLLTPQALPAFRSGFYLFWAGVAAALFGALTPTIMPDPTAMAEIRAARRR